MRYLKFMVLAVLVFAVGVGAISADVPAISDGRGAGATHESPHTCQVKSGWRDVVDTAGG